MKIFAVGGTLLFIVVGALVGARLLLLARRTRQLPELLVGGALFVYALVCQPAATALSPLHEALGPGAARIALVVALAANLVTLTGVYLFTWVVFRRGSGWAGGGIAVALAAGLAASVSLFASLPEGVPTGVPSMLTRLSIAGLSADFGVAMGWTALEAFRYHALMRRRLALGLADPVVANRFLVWALGCGACVAIVLGLIACLLAGLSLVLDPEPMLLVAASGTTTAVCWYLSFLPPAPYLRWVRARSGASSQ